VQKARADGDWTYRGLRTAVIENSDLRVVVLADKGGDVASLLHKPTDTEFLWQAPGGVRNPSRLAAPAASADLTWIDTYEGGWQSIFPNGGWSSSYGGLELGLHDESAVLPWDLRVVDPGPDRAVVELSIRLVRTPLAARRRLTLEVGSPTLRVEETIWNVGGVRFPLSYGQHIVFGPPFLSADCVIDMPGAKVRVDAEPVRATSSLEPDARSSWPAVRRVDGSERDLRRVPSPDAGTVDQLYLGDLADGWYAVTNTQRGVGLAVRFPADLYRYVWQWEVFGGHLDYPWWGTTYSLGLEPFTSATNRGLQAAVDDGSALWLDPGASVESELSLTPYLSTVGVSHVDESGSVSLRPEPDC